MKIVIIGAGISGCTAYLQLRKHLPKPTPDTDHEFTIYEPYSTEIDSTSTDREEGATHSSTLIVGGGLGVVANGLNVLKRLDEDLLRDIVRGGYAIQYSNMKTKNGSLLIQMESKACQSGDERPMHMVASSRHSLWKCLRMRIPDNVIVNKRISEVIANANNRNVVKFADGSPDVEADLVIGADGIKSTVKRALFPEANEDPYPPSYEGLVGVGGFLPSSEIEIEKGSMNFIFGGNGFFGYFYANSAATDPNRDSPYAVSEPGDTISWWSTYSIDECPDHKSIDREAVARQLRERHGEWKDPVVQKVIKSVRVDNMYPTWTSPPLPTWERDGVVLVGDAAHALPSTSGQGSSQALEDVEAFALFLSHYLRQVYEDPNRLTVATQKQAIQIAAKRYIDLRQPHVQGILEKAQQMQNNKRTMNFIQEQIMYCVLWIFGCFPSMFSKPIKTIAEYNIAEQVDRVLTAEKAENKERSHDG